MHVTCLLLVLVPLAAAAPRNSPVFVQIQTDASKSFNLGPYDRTRFDLVEQFHPLQTASIATGEQVQEMKRRIEGVKSVQTTEEAAAAAAEAALHDGSSENPETPRLLRLVFGEWSSWSEWTPCMAGERSRVRACSSRRPALRVICHGDAKEVQKCFSTFDAQIPVAKDPWTIEREISGDFKA